MRVAAVYLIVVVSSAIETSMSILWIMAPVSVLAVLPLVVVLSLLLGPLLYLGTEVLPLYSSMFSSGKSTRKSYLDSTPIPSSGSLLRAACERRDYERGSYCSWTISAMASSSV